MKYPTISVIIPCYNGAKYIDRCLNSLFKQSYQDFEVIIVDDGSIDGSFQILRNIERTDKRVRVVCQSNSGASAARNRGIDLSCGKYLTFIDIDDSVESQYLQNFHPDEVKGAGLIVQGMKELYAQNDEVYFSMGYEDEMFPSVCQAIGKLHILHRGHSVCKLYDGSIIRNRGVKFNPQWTYKEDLIFCLDYLKYAEYVKSYSGCYYNYFHNTGSLTAKRHAIDYLLRNTEEVFRKIRAIEKKENAKVSSQYISEYSKFCIQEQADSIYRSDMVTCDRIHSLKEMRKIYPILGYPRKYKSDTLLSCLFRLSLFHIYDLFQIALYSIRFKKTVRK